MVLGQSPAAAQQAKSLKSGLMHLRSGPVREWSSFPEQAEADHLEIHFSSAKNDHEASLRLRQQDVKQAWRVLVNGKSLGKRPGDTCVFVWPDAVLRDGKNVVRAVGTMKSGRRVTDTVTWTASRGATTRLGLPPTTATAPTTSP